MVWLSVGALDRHSRLIETICRLSYDGGTLGVINSKDFIVRWLFPTISKILWLSPSQWRECDNYYTAVARRFYTTKIAKTRKTLNAESCPIPIGWYYNAKLFIWAPLRTDRCVIATIVNAVKKINKKIYRSRLILYTIYISLVVSQITFQHSFVVWIKFHTKFK